MTEERLVPGISDPALEREHRHRYEWAAEHVAGRRVLDVACGSGYGSRLLAEAGAEHVLGLDVCVDAIEHARTHHAHPRVDFATGDAQDMREIPDANFDAVASFETIEHVPDDRAYLAEIARVLRPGGVFFVSTPDRRPGTLGGRIRRVPANPFHVREYVLSELIALLDHDFQVEEVRGQNFLNPVLTLLPVMAVVKCVCFALRRFGGQRLSNALYYNSTHTEPRPIGRRRWPVARYWVLRCTRRGTVGGPGVTSDPVRRAEPDRV